VARRNITAAGLTDRIELRKQCIEDMADKEVFDFAYFPQCFMSVDVVKRGLRNIWRALRPGGWITVITVCVPGVELQVALSRLRDMLFGGGGLIPAQVEAMLSDAGFTSVATFKFPRGATANIIAGQRPI
jgi:SAM-dependent methyltransferase